MVNYVSMIQLFYEFADFFSENRNVKSFVIQNNKIFAMLIIFHLFSAIDSIIIVSSSEVGLCVLDIPKKFIYDKGLTMKHRK